MRSQSYPLVSVTSDDEFALLAEAEELTLSGIMRAGFDVVPSEKDAMLRASQATPQTYTIHRDRTTGLRICLIGCHGQKDGAAYKLAALLNQMIKDNPASKPDFIVLLGDNYYPDGISSPTDPKVQEQFFDVFAHADLPYIRDIPVCVIDGNHDLAKSNETYFKTFGNRTTCARTTNPLALDPEQLALQQVAVTYHHAPNSFVKTDIAYAELPKHCKPSPFYSFIYGNTELFFLDANNYIKDYLSMRRQAAQGMEISLPNQAYWLEKKVELARLANRSVIYFTHQPFFTCGKRFYHGDAYLYLDQSEIAEWYQHAGINRQAAGHHIVTYNEMMSTTIFDWQKLPADLLCSAHDHHGAFYCNKEAAKCQIIAGNGGHTELQGMKYFGERQAVGGFIPNHGFTIISNQNEHPHLFQIDMYSLKWAHYLEEMGLDISAPQLSFSNQSSQALHPDIEDEEAKLIRQAIFDACESYQAYLHEMQTASAGTFLSPTLYKYLSNGVTSGINMISSLFYHVSTTTTAEQTHKQHDVDIKLMHEILSFLNNPIVFDKEIMLHFLRARMAEMSYRLDIDDYRNAELPEHSPLANRIEAMIYLHCGMSLKDVFEKHGIKELQKGPDGPQ